jgi:flagellin
LNQLSNKSTEIGAAQNRLESALESTMVNMDNLTSSLSTIRDADIAQVSSDYIRQQILQQAAATLMSTANQSPAIALQLI